VTGEHDCPGREGEEFFANPVEEQFTVATWQIPASDAALEEDIAADNHAAVGKVKTQTARAMTGHKEKAHRSFGDAVFVSLGEDEIGGDGLHIKAEAMAAKKCRIANHGRGVLVEANAAGVASLDGSGIGGVVEVPVREQKPVDFVSGKKLIRALRSIEEKVTAGGFEEKCVGIERSAGEELEVVHE